MAFTDVVWARPPLLQRFPATALEVSTWLPPAQNVSGPNGVTVGVGGVVFTVTITVLDTAEVQPKATTVKL